MHKSFPPWHVSNRVPNQWFILWTNFQSKTIYQSFYFISSMKYVIILRTLSESSLQLMICDWCVSKLSNGKATLKWFDTASVIWTFSAWSWNVIDSITVFSMIPFSCAQARLPDTFVIKKSTTVICRRLVILIEPLVRSSSRASSIGPEKNGRLLICYTDWK